MGIVFGFLCLLCLFGLLAKVITHKFHLGKADCLLMKIHKHLCVSFIVLCLVHFILVRQVFKTRSPIVYIAGIVIFIVFVLLVFLYHKMKNNSQKRLRWHRILSVIILLCIVAHISFYYIDFQKYQLLIQNIQLQEMDTSKIATGSYTGEYDAGYIYAKVQVTVSGGRIQKIEVLEHRNERGQNAEKIVENILETQKFPVDGVSGATNSSKVIQQAIQNALK